MSNPSPRSSMQRLIARWREAAAFEATEMGNVQYANALDQCADDLEALEAVLASLPQPEEHPCSQCNATESSDGDWFRLCRDCYDRIDEAEQVIGNFNESTPRRMARIAELEREVAALRRACEPLPPAPTGAQE